MGNDATDVYVFKRIINWTFEVFYLGCYVKSLVLKPKTLKFLQIAAIRHSFRVFAVVVQFPVIPRCFLGSKYGKVLSFFQFQNQAIFEGFCNTPKKIFNYSLWMTSLTKKFQKWIFKVCQEHKYKKSFFAVSNSRIFAACFVSLWIHKFVQFLFFCWMHTALEVQNLGENIFCWLI